MVQAEWDCITEDSFINPISLVKLSQYHSIGFVPTKWNGLVSTERIVRMGEETSRFVQEAKALQAHEFEKF